MNLNTENTDAGPVPNTEPLASVVHCKKEKYDVYIGRPSCWGNPFVIGKDGTREDVVRKYREWVLTQQYLIDKLPELCGKVLACWCSPSACHGDVLAELANELASKQKLTLSTRQL